MKSELQKYEGQTGKLVWLSAGVMIAGLIVWFMWSSYGGVLAAIGAGGLIWAFLRR